MAGQLVPLVMLPRYTTLAGSPSSDFTTIAMDVTAYESVTLNLWRGPFVGGTTPSMTVYFEESTDQNDWADMTGVSGGVAVTPAGTEVSGTGTIKKRWFRIRVELTGDPVVSAWAVGFLEERIS